MYNTLLEKLYNNSDSIIKPGLNNVKKLDEMLLFPSKKFKSIHVAGTNGKGSVSLKIAEALRLSGYKVGLFTSPHISSFRERIMIDGKIVSEESVAESLSHIFEILEKNNIPATFFEINTMLAFDLFVKSSVDLGVIETGLGGRLDATNIIDPLVSVITSISFDHVHLLGNTLEKIAYEKAGIIKKAVPVFLGPNADLPVIKKTAADLGSFCHISKQAPGWYDLENSEIAKDVLHYLQKKIPILESSIIEGLKKRPLCRLEIHTKEEGKISKQFKKLPRAIIFDVAHNEGGLLNLFKAIKYKFENIPIRTIVGMSRDKDLVCCSKIISDNASFIHIIDASHERLISKEEFSAYFQKEKISYKEELKDAVKNAVKLAEHNNEILLICGSFFIMKDVRDVLLEDPQKIF